VSLSFRNVGTYCDVEVVETKRAQHQVSAESGFDDQGDGQHEGCEQVQQRLVHFLEDEDFGADFPEAEFPVAKDVAHVVEHACTFVSYCILSSVHG
jgi:hypothetical protein